MTDGKVLRGWHAAYYGGQMPSPLPSDGDPVSVPEDAYDWFITDGVIHGTRGEHDPSAQAQSRLYYIRPLQDGESISYEFQYDPGRYLVHPTMGRLTFLMEPEGVRLHWLTDGDREWTGLPEDNAVTEPLNRRGSKPLPLKSGDWNGVTILLKDDTLTLSLNDATIYQRPLEPENRRTFGFYHDRNRSAVLARNVVIRGDWPERLTADQLDNLAAVSNPDRTKSDRHILNAIFQDPFIAENSLAVHRCAAKMTAERRYQFLSDWVLPNGNHPTFRLVGDFTATHPAPVVPTEDADDTRRIQDANQSGQSRVQIGGTLIAPAPNVTHMIMLVTGRQVCILRWTWPPEK